MSIVNCQKISDLSICIPFTQWTSPSYPPSDQYELLAPFREVRLLLHLYCAVAGKWGCAVCGMLPHVYSKMLNSKTGFDFKYIRHVIQVSTSPGPGGGWSFWFYKWWHRWLVVNQVACSFLFILPWWKLELVCLNKCFGRFNDLPKRNLHPCFCMPSGWPLIFQKKKKGIVILWFLSCLCHAGLKSNRQPTIVLHRLQMTDDVQSVECYCTCILRC
jgi:hypothetical protein